MNRRFGEAFSHCTNNLKQFGTALVTYSSAYNYLFPNTNNGTTYSKTRKSESFEFLRQTQLDEPKSYICPSTTLTPADTGKNIAVGNFSYTYFMGLKETDSPSSAIVADACDKDAAWNHDKKGAYLRLDSSVERGSGTTWYESVKYQNKDDGTTVKVDDFKYAE